MRSEEFPVLWECPTKKIALLKGLLYVCMSMNHGSRNPEQTPMVITIVSLLLGNRQPRGKLNGLSQRCRAAEVTGE